MGGPTFKSPLPLRASADLSIARRKTVQVNINDAKLRTSDALRALGWGADDADTQAAVMLYAELRGNNQGLTKLADPPSMAPAATADGRGPAVIRESAVSALVDGRQAPGMLALTRCCDIAIEKCSTGPGMALVASFNTTTSSGILAYYGERLAKRGLVGMVFAVSPEFVAAVDGDKGVYGTNPVCFAFPTASKEGVRANDFHGRHCDGSDRILWDPRTPEPNALHL